MERLFLWLGDYMGMFLSAILDIRHLQRAVMHLKFLNKIIQIIMSEENRLRRKPNAIQITFIDKLHHRLATHTEHFSSFTQWNQKTFIAV